MRAIGLMSGTSADGVDAALVRAVRGGSGLRLALEAWIGVPYPARLRRRLLAAAEGAPTAPAELAVLGRELGERFTEAVRALCRRARVPLGSIAVVGSHGHTLHHDPRGRGVTLQIGEAATIAVGTGITTVADFRPGDVAAGGEGAPLAPLVHAWLFRDRRRGRAVQNLGGIGNVTYLPPGRGTAGVIAFDTGPGNMVIDALVRRISKGTRWFDRGGRAAARGRVDWPLVRGLLRHPYFREPPPKSSGRELFGAAYVDQLVARGRRRRLAADDLVATATALTAASCADACARFVRRRGPLDEMILCGGGAANPALVGFLRDLMPGVRVRTTGDLGLPAQAIEPVAFAGLAAATVLGLSGNLPAVTGASRPLVLGKITPGANYRRLALAAGRVAPPGRRR